MTMATVALAAAVAAAYEVQNLTLWDRLTYAGDATDTVINWVLVAFALAPFLIGSGLQRRDTAVCVVGACCLQGALWALVPWCYGVSLVWCALCGASCAAQRLHRRPVFSAALVSGSTAATALGIAYYLSMYPFVTTAAHVAAVVVGGGTAWCTVCPRPSKEL